MLWLATLLICSSSKMDNFLVIFSVDPQGLVLWFIFEVKVKSLSCVWLFATPWTITYQAPLSMGFSRQEYWNGLLFPSPGDLPNPGIEPRSPALQADTLLPEPFSRILLKDSDLVRHIWILIRYFPNFKMLIISRLHSWLFFVLS